MCGYLVFRHPTVVSDAGQRTAPAQPLAPPPLVSLVWHSLTHTSDTTRTSPLWSVRDRRWCHRERYLKT